MLLHLVERLNVEREQASLLNVAEILELVRNTTGRVLEVDGGKVVHAW